MRYLAPYEAQMRVDAQEFRRLQAWQTDLWLTLLVACSTPGIPIDNAHIREQLQAVWGATSVTYTRLVA